MFNSDITQQHLAIAIKASIKTGDAIMQIHSGEHAIEFKADNSPLTEADKNVAEGKADVYPRFAATMEWDTAAGQAICKAAVCR